VVQIWFGGVSASSSARVVGGFGLASIRLNSVWSEGVDMDFLRSSVPGSRGALVGQGVSGTYPVLL